MHDDPYSVPKTTMFHVYITMVMFRVCDEKLRKEWCQ